MNVVNVVTTTCTTTRMLLMGLLTGTLKLGENLSPNEMVGLHFQVGLQTADETRTLQHKYTRTSDQLKREGRMIRLLTVLCSFSNRLFS